MIEAVNSSVANSQVLRIGQDRQVGSVLSPVPASLSVDDGEVRQAPKAPYVSPYISIDLKSNKAVIQIRDADTGEVEQQFPTKSRLAQLSQLQAKYDNSKKVESQDIASKDSLDNSTSDVNAGVITVQDIASSTPSNSPSSSPDLAVAALSAGAQSGQAVFSAPSVSVFA